MEKLKLPEHYKTEFDKIKGKISWLIFLVLFDINIYDILKFIGALIKVTTEK